MPYVSLVKNKEQQHRDTVLGVYEGVTESDIMEYINSHSKHKICVTYDSVPYTSFRNNCHFNLVVFGEYKNGIKFARTQSAHSFQGFAPQGEYDIHFIERDDGFSWSR